MRDTFLGMTTQLVCVFLLKYTFVGNNCSFISNAPATVYEGHDFHLLNQLKHPFLHNCESDFLSISSFSCHSNPHTSLSSFSSTHSFNTSLTRCDGMISLLFTAHTGSGCLRCRFTPRSSANFAASLTNDLCPGTQLSPQTPSPSP